MQRSDKQQTQACMRCTSTTNNQKSCADTWQIKEKRREGTDNWCILQTGERIFFATAKNIHVSLHASSTRKGHLRTHRGPPTPELNVDQKMVIGLAKLIPFKRAPMQDPNSPTLNSGGKGGNADRLQTQNKQVVDYLRN